MSVVLNKVLTKLTSFTKRYYINELIKGGLLFFAIGLLYFLVVLILENFLWFSPSGRRNLFWTFVGIELLLFAKFIGVPLAKLFKLSKGISEIEASKIIGDHFPKVNDQLVNLLQLKEQSNTSELLQASIEQKSKELSPIPFNLAINFKKSFTYAKYALIPILGFVLFTVINGKDWYGKSFERVVNYNTAYEPPAPFYFKVLNDNLEVIQQEDFNLQVTTYGSLVPNQVAVSYNNETYFLKKEAHNKFSYTFKNPAKDIDFNLQSGEEESKAYQLSVNAAPSINDFQMQVTPPSHVPTKTKVYSNTGNALVPEGSKINWLVRSENASQIKFLLDSTTVEFTKVASEFNYTKRVASALEYQITTSNEHVKSYEKLAFAIDVIKDKKPSISVQTAKDTTQLNEQLFYGQLSDDYGLRKLEVVYFKADNEQDIKRIPVSIQSGIFSDFTYQFPNGIPLEDATSYAFYFEVFDNDSFRGSKSTKSETFNYRQLSKVEEEQSSFKNEQQQLDSFSKTLDEFQKSEMDLESFSKLQKQQTNLSFKEKQKLDDVLDKQSKQQESLKKLSKKLDKTLEKLNDDENSEAIKEQLERTKKELEKNKKLIDEIKKALEKLSPKDLQKKVDELQKDNKKLTKNLNQVLELTKRYYVIDKHQRVAQMLELLSKKQLDLAKETSTEVKDKQTQINKEWDIVQEELNDLRKHNSKLKKPMQLDDDPAYEEKINEELKDALKEVSKGNTDEAKKKQNVSGVMLKNLADKMQMEDPSGGGGDGPEELEEDLEMLRQILDNLVLFSLNQESNMDSFKVSNANNPSYSSYVRRQNVLREHFNHVDDSLYALSSRNPKIGTEVNDLISDIDYDLNSSIIKLTDNNTNGGVINLQYAVTHANDLALMLSQSLMDMNEQMKPGKKGGKGKKSKGFQLPDIIKKQESLNEAMKQMMEAGEKKPGDAKKEEAGGQKKPGDKGQAGEEGKEGKEGEKGEAGDKGNKGQSGQNGQQGENGEKGQGQGQGEGEGESQGEGENGKPGENGKNGKGKNPGKEGKEGEGENGEGDNEGDGKNGEGEGKEKGDKGKKGKGKGDGGGNGDGESDEPSEEESDYGQIFEIYKQQQELRNQLSERLSQEGITPNEKRILSQMEQVENELLEKGFTDDVMKRMVNLKHQLFKLDKAQFQQGEDTKRKSETNKKGLESEQLTTPAQIKQYFNTTEILNRQVLPLQPEFKKKVQEYFISND